MSCAMDNPLYCRIDCTTDRSLHESRTRLERSNESPEARVKTECGVKILRRRFAPSKPILKKKPEYLQSTLVTGSHLTNYRHTQK